MKNCSCNTGKPMNLDEAIEHAKEKAENEETPCQKQHGQLASWLQELKMFRTNYGICDIK